MNKPKKLLKQGFYIDEDWNIAIVYEGVIVEHIVKTYNYTSVPCYRINDFDYEYIACCHIEWFNYKKWKYLGKL